MVNWRSLSQLAGRSILGLFYVFAGVIKIPTWEQTVERMRAEEMPFVPLLLIGSMIFQIVGGLMITVGWRARLGAVALIIFTVPAIFIFSDFWNVDPTLSGYATFSTEELVRFNFFGGVWGIGFCVFILGTGPGGYSLENRRVR